VLREGATADAGELQEHVARSLADFKVPRRLVVVDAIPKGPTGKQQRMGLAARLGLDRPSDESGDAPYEAPRTPLESALGALWERVLGADRVGRDDDFFQLGGDSILGAELITRLSEAGIERTDVPLAVLAWAPTVASLAAWLETGERASAGALVPVRSDGALPPLYFVHGGDGDVVALAGLARFLPDRPFVCVRSPALDGEAPSRDVASIAGRYADEIAASAGQGAIAVGGICTGGPIALEVGRELSARGREVGALVLVDPTAAPRRGDGPLAVLRTHLESSGGSRGLVRTSRARAAKLARRLGALPALSAPEERARRSEEAMAAAVRKHRLVPYPGPMTVIHSDGFPTPRPLWEWVAAGGLEWHEIEGPHSSLLRGDRIDVLGEVLAASLEGEPTAAR
jgi:thioesterase domain-containing protein